MAAGTTIEPLAVQLVDLRTSPNGQLLDRIAAPGGLYETAFPVEQEREDPAAWSRALWGDDRDGNPFLRVLVQEGPAADTHGIQGFVVTELYRRSRCGLISYVAVDADGRRHGLGRTLITEACARLHRDAEDANGGGLRAIFAEIHDPAKTPADADSMDPVERTSFFAKLDARRVPITYVQPELRPGAGPARMLDLIALPGRDGKPAYELETRVVRDFLEELYEVTDGDAEDLEEMLGELEGEVVELEPLNLHVEDPALTFDMYGVAFHFVVERPSAEPFPAASAQFASFERDLLAYSFRDQPPFSSAARHVHNPYRVVRMQAARELRYVSEGRTASLYRRDEPPMKSLQVRASETRFRDGVVVYHLVLTPPLDVDATAGDDSVLTEYDLIRLIKQWEQGEDVTGPYEHDGANECVLFRCRDDRALTLRGLAAEVFDDEQLRRTPPRAGTVQLIVEEQSWDRVLEAAAKLAETGTIDADVWKTYGAWLKGLGGVIQGLLDFENVDEDELADVFRSTQIDDGLRVLHKGTLLTLGRADRPFEAVRRSFGISPYNLLPQAVLLHNEHQLRVAADAAARAGSGRFRELEHARSAMQQALNRRWLPNVFHYDLERELYTEGHDRRALAFRNEDLQRRLTEVSAEYDGKVNRRRSVADDARNALLLGLGYTGARAAFPHAPDAALAPAFGALAALYLAWRWDLAGLALRLSRGRRHDSHRR